MKATTIDGADILEAFGVDTTNVQSAVLTFKAGEPPTLTLMRLVLPPRGAELKVAVGRYTLKADDDA